jgi:hypothetical protein
LLHQAKNKIVFCLGYEVSSYWNKPETLNLIQKKNGGGYKNVE